jgi:L-seryl-tRNA(Ser) seleniumtransferase
MTVRPNNLFSRRRFFRSTTALAAGLGVAPLVPSANAAQEVAGEDYYNKLGVPTIINAAGTYTTLTAACMPPVVLAAVQKAALHPVRLHDLQVKSGEYIAKRLQCEGAVVTSGAAGAITLATAACMQYANTMSPMAMPQSVDGLKNQVIVQKAHRYGYDHAIFLCGARITEVLTLDDYKRACAAGNAVMTNFFNAAEEEDGVAGTAQIGREEWLRVAHEHNIPCHLDAAADMPPISNLWKYTGMGFDLVCFSGGKGMRGPQNAGLLLGKKHLTDLAQENNNPNEGVGRGMKVAKEQIVGMVAAVDWFLAQSDDGMQAEFHGRAERIAAHLKDIPTLKHDIVVPAVANAIPHLVIRYDQGRVGKSPLEVSDMLRKGSPSIELNPSTGRKAASAGLPGGEDTIVVGVWMLQPGEDLIVARRLHEVLKAAT